MSVRKKSQTTSQLNIGILETYTHVPLLYSFIKICNLNNTHITIFTTKKINEGLKSYLTGEEKSDLILKKDTESYYSFLKRVEKTCNNKIDLLFVNTIKEFPIDLAHYLNFKPKCKTILTIHHVNTWLSSNCIFNLKKPRKTFETNLCLFLISSCILPKFDAINVIYSPMKNYIKKNTSYKKKVFTLPFSLFEQEKTIKEKKDDGKIRIVIPGLIQEHRKDYSHVFSAFENLFEKYNEKIKLYIPGKPVGDFGKQIYNRFNSMKQKGCDIEIYDDFVPDKLFDEILANSDIILAPIRIKTKSNTEIKEFYGETVGSGVTFGAIRYVKPIIVPSEFNMQSELESSTAKYNNAKELEKILTDLIVNQEKLQQMKKEALINAKSLSIQYYQDYFKKNVIDWLWGANDCK